MIGGLCASVKAPCRNSPRGRDHPRHLSVPNTARHPGWDRIPVFQNDATRQTKIDGGDRCFVLAQSVSGSCCIVRFARPPQVSVYTRVRIGPGRRALRDLGDGWPLKHASNDKCVCMKLKKQSRYHAGFFHLRMPRLKATLPYCQFKCRALHS